MNNAKGADAAAPTAEPDSPKPVTPLAVAIGLVVLFVLALAAPVLMGLEDIMGLIIIGIALFEAWKINKRTVLNITGPHHLGANPPLATEGGVGGG